jgi:type II secretory pathway pseudopilin PulG
VIVMLVILSIAAAVIVPKLSNASDLQVMGAARMLAADLQYAQDTAITTQVPVTVTFNTGAESYQLSNASGLLKNPITKTDYVVGFRTTPGTENVDVYSVNFNGGSAVTFDVLGAPGTVAPLSPATHNIVLQARANVYYIDVASATGRVSVQAKP